MARSVLRTLIDTSVAIWALEGEPKLLLRLDDLDGTPILSSITVVELESGLSGVRRLEPLKRARLTSLVSSLDVRPFRLEEAVAYGRIVEARGFSRARMVDRMIAAQAIVADARLITINGDDFKNILGLDLEIWPSPG